MAGTYYLVEGATGPQDFSLLEDGAAINGAGLTLGLSLVDRRGLPVTLSGSFAWLVDTDGSVRLLRAAADLPRSQSPYFARWTTSDGATTDHFPGGADRDQWIIVP